MTCTNRTIYRGARGVSVADKTYSLIDFCLSSIAKNSVICKIRICL
jgi:hypothetical protein